MINTSTNKAPSRWARGLESEPPGGGEPRAAGQRTTMGVVVCGHYTTYNPRRQLFPDDPWLDLWAQARHRAARNLAAAQVARASGDRAEAWRLRRLGLLHQAIAHTLQGRLARAGGTP